MARVTSVDVQQIYPDFPGTDFAPFIEAADLLITEQLLGQGLSDDRLAIIEKWIAAHYAVLSLEKGGLSRERTGDGENWYQPAAGTNAAGFSTTRFGKSAIALDTSGTLSSLSIAPGLKAQFRVVSNVPKQCT